MKRAAPILILAACLGVAGCEPAYEHDGDYYGYDQGETSVEEESEESAGHRYDSDANVDYYNPRTGYHTDYELDVEWDDDKVERINFNNGGYLDGDWFDRQTDNGDGTVTVEYDGREFTVEKD